ncbi:LPXTG cell wall anchor domain-containing protein [Cellulomonas cellasea]|uniref:LPXTG-motif cell wall-anchored protein n=1 Tax=Cellulomonas cellasea TaxID=43670 RepID=A0A7W4YBY9_9CELL|nr:LPXTG cell wall anchor domain-containing protein [Cellulomonas cellasea]MBB2924143.1 LPXTG-motif cell wall-anchored protein [Cellulomonas cellasea]
MRVSAAAALSAAVGLAFALPAAAAVAPTPNTCDDTGGYSAGGVCGLKVEVLSPVCDNDVPYLAYKVSVEGGATGPLTVTWDNPSGADVVQSGLPLEGRVPWPGAVAGADGKGADWPGWTKKSDGTWAQGDEYDWVRPSVAVTLAVNASVTTTVAYPPSSPVCLTSPASSSVLAAAPASSQVLAATGSETTPWLVAAGALVLAGGGLVAARARSRRDVTS